MGLDEQGLWNCLTVAKAIEIMQVIWKKWLGSYVSNYNLYIDKIRE